ncbi:hypothetical protein Tco_1002454 [Tanacetum coccineum]|uniref:Uncharacterized protein n=1 Tax=Tanacetum coccineum TaxID=301880 RepID=A0ABQ5F6B3_9ASTR
MFTYKPSIKHLAQKQQSTCPCNTDFRASRVFSSGLSGVSTPDEEVTDGVSSSTSHNRIYMDNDGDFFPMHEKEKSQKPANTPLPYADRESSTRSSLVPARTNKSQALLQRLTHALYCFACFEFLINGVVAACLVLAFSCWLLFLLCFVCMLYCCCSKQNARKQAEAEWAIIAMNSGTPPLGEEGKSSPTHKREICTYHRLLLSSKVSSTILKYTAPNRPTYQTRLMNIKRHWKESLA